jgi:glycine dehydrogenase subunit 1
MSSKISLHPTNTMPCLDSSLEVRAMTVPYIPNTEQHRESMLRTIGVNSEDDLFQDIPSRYRNPLMNLPDPISELELLQELQDIARTNVSPTSGSFIGVGAYRHFIPSVVGYLASRGEFATSYTPYQPEVSQGTLQATYEFQSMVAELLGMDVANAGMYDGASSLAEAALMSCRVTGLGRVAVLETVSPFYLDVLNTYAAHQGIEVYRVDPKSARLKPDTASLVIQHPNFYGYLEDLAYLRKTSNEAKALMIVSTDPIAMGMFKSPGEYGADISSAEGQPLGTPLNFGGPYVGLFACKEEFLRNIPGRIVGRTVDNIGRSGFVLTLQTREQHIRRERATSNICTSEALIALRATIYVATMGKWGLRRVAELCYHKAHYVASLIANIPGYSIALSGTFFQEFVVKCPISPTEINRALLDKGIVGGLDISSHIPNAMLLCVTEMNTRKEIDNLQYALKALQT